MGHAKALILAAIIVLAEQPGMLVGEGQGPIVPMTPVDGLDLRKVRLGQKLFHDGRLSRDGSISCASCHLIDKGGMDNLPRSPGVDGKTGDINTPTIINAAYNLAQFWDGRAPSLADQIAGPINSPLEMASSWPLVLASLRQDRPLMAQFELIYAAGLAESSIVDAIVTYERYLVAVDSPFDRWLRGDREAIPEQAAQGYQLFRDYGCIACHQGVNVGGNMYAELGTGGDYFVDRGGKMTDADLGRFNVTGNEQDKYVFKVPSLRLVSMTAPYFHDASIMLLKDAVAIMGKYQLKREIPDKDCDKIVAFLNSLAGDWPAPVGE